MDSLNIVFYGILNIAPSEYRPVELVVAYHRLIVSTGTVGELRDLLKERFEQTTQVRVTHWQRLQAYATEMKKSPSLPEVFGIPAPNWQAETEEDVKARSKLRNVGLKKLYEFD